MIPASRRRWTDIFGDKSLDAVTQHQEQDGGKTQHHNRREKHHFPRPFLTLDPVQFGKQEFADSGHSSEARGSLMGFKNVTPQVNELPEPH
jgi:hypothetical protein